jgi:cation:H+ antiporter
MIEYLYLVAGLILLMQGSDWLLEGAASLAKKFNIHKLIIGLTIVAFGTSLPELFVTIVGSTTGGTDIVLGNLFGSNIANILLILGITALIMPFPLHHNTIWKEIPFSFLTFVIVLLLSHKAIFGMQNMLTPTDGVILLLLFVLFIYYAADLIRERHEEKVDTKEEIELAEPKFKNLYMVTGSLVIGVIALYIGGKMAVDSVIIIASNLGISQYFISATVLAIGTSLPELFVSVRAALKKELDLAVGNIIGSNIFNTVFILGIAAIIRPIEIPDTLIIDVIIMMVATLMLFLFMFIGKKNMLKRWQGVIFLLCYGAYIFYLIFR